MFYKQCNIQTCTTIEKLRLIGGWNYSTGVLLFHVKFLLLVIIFFAIKFFSKNFMVTTTDQRGEVFAITYFGVGNKPRTLKFGKKPLNCL